MPKQYLKYMMMRKHIHVLFDLKLKRFTLPQTCTAKFIRRCKIYVHYTVFFTIFAPCPRIKFSFIVLHESVKDPISICECRRFCSLIMLTARMPYNWRASFVYTLITTGVHFYKINCISVHFRCTLSTLCAG